VSRPPLVAWAAIALALLAGGLLATVEVVEEGQLLPYNNAEAKKLSILGSFEVYVQRDPPSAVDSFGAMLLVGITGIALLLALALPASRDRGWFYGLLAAGTAYLAIDELLGGHETIGANIQSLGNLPGVESPEDVIIALYALPALAFLWWFRDAFRASRLGMRLVGLGLALYIVSAVFDVHGAIMDEQFVEVASMAALFAGFLCIALKDLELCGVRREAPGAAPEPVATAPGASTRPLGRSSRG
jgi:hypothetical protein